MNTRLARATARSRLQSPRTLLIGALALAFLIGTPRAAVASRHTPAEWKRRVPDFPKTAFSGQFKHVGWLRDRNGDFLDDAIPKGRDSLHVVLELNECYPPSYLSTQFARFGRIEYIGRLVSCVYLAGVRPAMLDSLARRPEVAMVVWAAPFRPCMGLAAAAVRATSGSLKAEKHYVRELSGSDFVDPDGNPAITGLGVNIAIVDTGVRNKNATLPGDGSSAGDVVAGYDATIATETDPDAWGPDAAHGTMVASIALGRAHAGAPCYEDGEGVISPDCAGIAPGAGLVDVKVVDTEALAGVGTTTESACAVGTKDLFAAGGALMGGLDWIARWNADAPSERQIRVVNISLSDFVPCDGTCPVCKEVDYLTSLGVTVVSGLGNLCYDEIDDTKPENTVWRVASPAAASGGIAVAGIDDNHTQGLDDDASPKNHVYGPRMTKDGGEDLTLEGQKPDLAAPSENIVSMSLPESPGADEDEDFYKRDSGTSLAAPQVAGAAALMLKVRPALTPAEVKDILRSTADRTVLGAGAVGWNSALGMGCLDVYGALQAAGQTDLRFQSCTGPAVEAGIPCPLSDGLPRWLNKNDLTVAPDPPRTGVSTVVKAAIVNDGPADARNFYVSFGYYEFGAGTRMFYSIETVPVPLLSAYGSTEVECSWTPTLEGHQCLSATIVYGLDSEPRNNTTQRNIAVEASTYDLRIENPYMKPATFYVQTTSQSNDWPCTVDRAQFRIGGPEDCPAKVRVGFRPPKNAPAGARADCAVSVFARPDGARDSTLIGGVTVRTYVPNKCRVIGQVVTLDGLPRRGVKLTFQREVPPGVLRADWERDRKTTTDRDGVFDIDIPEGAHHTVRVEAGDMGTYIIPVRVQCGVGSIRIQVGRDGARILE